MRQYLSKIILNLTRKERMNDLNKLNISQYHSINEIKELQKSKMLTLLSHIRQNVPYFKENINELNLNTNSYLTKIPFLTKKIIRVNKEYMKAENYPDKNFLPNLTSGSTGEKLEFFSDSTNEIKSAITLRNNMWTGWGIGEKRVELWGSHYDISKTNDIFSKIKNLFINRNLVLSSYNMTQENMYDYYSRINKYKPKLITGYASALYLFSRFLEEHSLDCYSPKGIISSAEVLFEHQRNSIEKAFGCKVFDRYGCREVGNIAHECEEQNGLHINAEHVIVEVVDETGEPCEPGEPGEIAVTDLNNFAFPFIRYKIGDIGVLSDRKCPCDRGLPLLESVEGRVWDVIVGTNGNRLVGTFWLIKDIKGIKKFQIIQEKFGELLVKLVVNKDFNEKERKKIISRVHEKCGKEMKICVENVNHIHLTESGKHRFVISKVSPFVN